MQFSLPPHKPRTPRPAKEKPASGNVTEHLVLDGRCALFHRGERWLAVADLHYGYELSQRAAGALFPRVGMEDVRERLLSLAGQYRPAEILMLGDLVHDRRGIEPFCDLLAELREHCTVHLIAGNHDRGLCNQQLHEHLRRGPFLFHHGHRELVDPPGENHLHEVCGHHHPAVNLRDGAGLRIKLPALVQDRPHGNKGPQRWILPAFSPWAAGGCYTGNGKNGSTAPTRRWGCHPRGIIPLVE